MKNIALLLRFSVLTFLVLALSACGDGLADINEDPNSPTDVPAANLFTQGTYYYFDNVHSRAQNAEWGMLMVQYWAQNEYTEEQRYDIDGADANVDTPFQEYYVEVLNELKAARDRVSEDANLNESKRANQLACIDVMMSAAYMILTDGWGMIPYSQALDGLNFPNPAYDNQEAIYDGILSTLEGAMNSIDASETGFDSGDPLYGGDMSGWKKLAASMLMRAAMRISDVNSAKAGQYVTSASGNIMTSSADNAVFGFSSDPSLANPNYEDRVINNRDDFCVTDVLVDRMKAANDPRLEIYAQPTLSGDIVGMPYGLEDGAAFALKDGTSRPNDGVRSSESPSVLIDFAEVSFLKAEAVERGYMSGDAAQFYADGIQASMDFWGVDAAAAADYIANNPYDAANWKESIGMQKWLAFYTNGLQAWAEWRRLDAPSLDVPAAAVNDVIPVRLPYAISEQTRNASSLSAATSDPNDLSTKVWWDVN